MKQMLLILILMLCAILVRAQTSIGLDLSSFLYKELNIGLGHRISQHWSIHGSAGLNMKILKREIGKEELEHDSNFNSNSQPSVRYYAHREKFGFRYWPNTAYSGMHLNIGGEYRTDAGLDATLGIGYMFPIWKKLTGSIAYDIGIIRSQKTGKLTIEDLKLELSWIF